MATEAQIVRNHHLQNRLALLGIFCCTCVVLFLLLAILFYVFAQGWQTAFSLDYLFSAPVGGKRGGGGLLYPLFGTFYLIAACLLLAIPVGVFAAVYLAEYASARSKLIDMARFAVESLAGIPSVIYGLFGLSFFVSFLGFRHSVLAASLSVAIMLLPIIIRTTEEALQSVPTSLRDASLALGASKAQTIFRVVLPAAFPGILTGIMLSIGRAIAESAIIILTMGGSITALPRLLGAAYPFLLPDSSRTLSVHLYYQSFTYDNLEQAFATALILICLILVLNLLTWFVMSKK